ncbi:unnamed protein product [Cuscuta campestris]|uniref:Uncharacterized protein n=1 Tax=Cuscuta campestris TaxID=132261 RepID=A0A484MTY6_9ASTE|nr:unnamed protein product [Cuscuta campestris]
MGFKFRIEYKTGASNRAADALSRREEDTHELELFTSYAQPIPKLCTAIRTAQLECPILQRLHAAVRVGTGPPHVSIHDGILYYKLRIYIPTSSPICEQLLREFHSTPLAGHQGVERTFRRLAAVFYWTNMRRSVRDFVASCTVCQATKYITQKPAGLGMSPFQALYGREPPNLFATMSIRSRSPAVEELLRERADLLQDLKTNLTKMQHRMRDQANRHRRDVTFQPGDLVLLKLQPYRQHSVARPGSQKLSRRYYGPFPVIERIGAVAYRLQLPEGCRIHDVVHVSLLRPFVQRGSMLPEPSLPADFYKTRPIFTPVSAVRRRIVLVDGTPQEQWLVQWSTGSTSDTTWEPVQELRRHFPELALEDKVVSKAGGVDTDTFVEHEEDHESAEETTGVTRPRRTTRRPKRYDDYV